MSTVSLIFAKHDNEYDAYEALHAEVAVREAHGLTADLEELRDAIKAQDDEWGRQQDAEIWAENAIERYYEGGWDKSGRYAAECAADEQAERYYSGQSGPWGGDEPESATDSYRNF